MLFHFLFPIICCAVLAISTIAEEDGYDDEAIERGDGYIDKLLKEMFEDNVEEYDPYRIEDSVVGFHRKVAFVNISGEAKLHDGYILGLKTLHRPNHCSLKDENGRLNIKADLGAGALDFHYSGSVKFMSIGPTISVEGTLGYLEVHMEFAVDSATGKNGTLRKFVIDDMRGLKVWVTGLGPLNWAVNPIVTGVTKIFKRFLRNFLENKVEKHIAEHITNFQFPVDGVNPDTTEPSTETETELPRTEPITDSTSEEPVIDTETTQTENEVTEEVVDTEPTENEVTEEVVDTEPTENDSRESADISDNELSYGHREDSSSYTEETSSGEEDIEG